MTRSTLCASLLVAGLAAACGGDDDNNTNPDGRPPGDPDGPPGSQRIDVPAGDLANGGTWTTGNTYVLKGQVFVTGGTLTIQPGVRVEGDAGSVLAITKAATIDAQGTAGQPIVMTSSALTKAPGDWGGVVLLGESTINVAGGSELVEGFPAAVGDKVSYGGSNEADSCGTLRYVRIEYAGFALSPDNELNGLTVGGCGAGTTLDYIQVHGGLDDGVELFGGTAGIRHLVITQPGDDGLDFDFGWRGTAQWVIVQQRPTSGERGIEGDNSEEAPTAAPVSNPLVCNFTFVGGGGSSQIGAMLRRGTAARIANSLFHATGIPVDVNGGDSAALANAGSITLTDSLFWSATGATGVYPAAWDNTSDPGGQDDCPGGNNCFLEEAVWGSAATNQKADAQLARPGDLANPSFAPAAGSPALTAGAPPSGCDASATYKGAIGATDWTAGWTAYPALN